MKDLRPKAGTLVRFNVNGKELVGYVTGRDERVDALSVCTKPGTYYWVDRALAVKV